MHIAANLLVARSGSAALPNQIIEHRYRRQYDQDRRERDRGDEANLLEAKGVSQAAGNNIPSSDASSRSRVRSARTLVSLSVTTPK